MDETSGNAKIDCLKIAHFDLEYFALPVRK